MMDNAQLAKASFDDIVFEGRNKQYGAYVLRGLYNKHVTRALIVSVVLFVIFIFIPVIAQKLKPEEELVEKPVLKKTVMMEAPPLDETAPPPPPPPPPPPQAAPPPPPPAVATVRFTPPVVKRDEEIKKVEEVPDQSELKEAAISTKTQEGEKTTAPPISLEGLEGGKGKEPVAEIVENKPYMSVEQMPEPPGGINGLLQYLAKNIKYPSMALRNQVEGRVYVNFVVGPTGAITDVKVTKGIGSGCDEEAMRVIKNMPPWTPGRQNGRAVSVYYTVPVTFTIR